MRIVDRATFLKLPAGTVFAKFGGPEGNESDAWFEDVCIKEDTCGNDFVVQDLLGQFDGWTGSESHSEEIERLRGDPDHQSPPLDYDSAGRDGLFDPHQRFAVFSDEDACRMIDRLAQAIEEQRAATSGAVHENAPATGCTPPPVALDDEVVARLAITTEALVVALGPWSGAAMVNGIKLIADNRALLTRLQASRK